MRRGVLASALLGLAACGEPAISVHLALTETPSKPFTYDCIGAVDVFPIPKSYNGAYDIGQVYYSNSLGTSAPVEVDCIDLDHAPTSAADLVSELHGRLDIAIPAAGLDAIELRARAGHCSDASWYHESIMYGGGVYNGGNNLTIDLSHNISCADTVTYTFHPVDLLAMASSHTCDPVTTGVVYVGDIRPTHVGPPTILETGAQYADLSGPVTEGKLQTYSASFGGTCLAMGYFDPNSNNVSDSCIDPSATHLCDPNAFDVPFVSASYLDNSMGAVEPLVNGDYEAPVLVAVYQDQNGQKVPVPGAVASVPTSAPASETPSARFVYGDLGDPASQSFVPQMNMTSTTSSGLFMAFLDGITEVDVTAPGPNGTTLTGKTFVGPDPFVSNAALIVVK